MKQCEICYPGVLTYQCQEFSVLEDDADADDDPIIDAGGCKSRISIYVSL